MNIQIANRFLFIGLLFFIATFDGLAQDESITGTIKDVSGNAIQNAVISILENPGAVVISDQDGKFVINGKIGQHIRITDPEFYHKTLKITDNTMVITIDSNDELVPVGYGMKFSKEEMTMAVDIVKSDKLSKSSVINPLNALSGKMPGLAVLQNGGLAWTDNASLFIRGVGTTGNRSILVLVDGYERSISSLCLAEIGSIVLLKDAATLALYGLRGANGVLLVTTKTNGLNQKSNINIGFESGITQPFRLPDFLGAYDYAQKVNEASSNDGLQPRYSQYDLDAYRLGNSPYFPNVNWSKTAFRDFGRSNNLNISFNGGSKLVKFFSLLSYQDDNGLLRPVDLNKSYSTQDYDNKLNFRTNIDVNLTATTKLMVKVGGLIEKNNQPSSSVNNIMSAIYNIPSAAFPVRTFDGKYGGTSTYNNNPVALIAASGHQKFQNRDLEADIRLEQKLDFLLKGLSVEAAYADNNYSSILERWTQNFQYEQTGVIRNNATGMITDTVKTLYGTNTTLNFSSNISNIRTGRVILGKLMFEKAWGSNAINSSLLFQQDQKIQITRFNTYLHQIIAGNIHYSNTDKYFADLSMSYSGTNLLPKKSRFGFFPALSVGWKLSKEDWFNAGSIINDLKIRASWGMSGSDLIPQNTNVPFNNSANGYRFQANNTSFGGWSEGAIRLGEITYEKSYKSNIGIDASLFKKLDIGLDAFYETRNNILVTNVGTISDVVGINRAYQVGGIVHNRGIDLNLNFTDTRNNFTYYFNGQFEYVKNKIVNMFEAYKPYDYLKLTGESIGQAFGLQAIGFFKDFNDINNSPVQKFSQVKPGDIKYKDQNKDGIIDQFDNIPLGFSTTNPEINFSGSIGIEYKGIGLDALFQGIANYTIYANTSSVFWPLVGNTNISTFSNDAWTPETAATATLPRLTVNQNLNNYRANSIWLIDGSFLKLRSLEIYYDFPDKLISKMKMTNTRVYLRGMNLFSLDHVNVVDPEAIGAVYPTLTSYNLGIKIGF